VAEVVYRSFSDCGSFEFGKLSVWIFSEPRESQGKHNLQGTCFGVEEAF